MAPCSKEPVFYITQWTALASVHQRIQKQWRTSPTVSSGLIFTAYQINTYSGLSLAYPRFVLNGIRIFVVHKPPASCSRTRTTFMLSNRNCIQAYHHARPKSCSFLTKLFKASRTKYSPVSFCIVTWLSGESFIITNIFYCPDQCCGY